MEVLARYCSIPGYSKLCCESCSKRSSTLSSLLTEAAEVEEEIRFGSASQLLETLSASINQTLNHPLQPPNQPGGSAKQTSTGEALKPNTESKTAKRLMQASKPNSRNLPAMTVYKQHNDNLASASSQHTDRLLDISKVERWRQTLNFFSFFFYIPGLFVDNKKALFFIFIQIISVRGLGK